MKGLPKMPRIGELSGKQIEELELFVERHSLDIEVGRQKTAAFVYRIYKEEESKKKKGEEYGKRLLKDAEKMILSMKVAEKTDRISGAPPQKESRRSPMRGRMLELAPSAAPGGDGRRMVVVREKDLLEGEFESIKMRAAESKNREGKDSVLYLREGYQEGRPAIKIKGCPFSIIEDALPGSWKISVGRGEGGLRVSASEAILGKIDFNALRVSEGGVLLLSPNYILTLYGQGLPLEKEVEMLVGKAPNYEVHISNGDLGMLRAVLGKKEITEIERLGYEGKIYLENIGKAGEDSYSAYVDALGSELNIVPVDTISSYRRLPEREFKVDEGLRPLSSKIIPQPVPREDVIATLKEMGFFEDPSREQTHSRYRWHHREIKDENGEKVKDEWVNLSFHPQIDRKYLDNMLHEVSKREFERAWIKVHA